MAEAQASRTDTALLYHFCRLRWPALPLPPAAFERHLGRAIDLYRAKRQQGGLDAPWADFVEGLHAPDLFLSAACLEGEERAWEALFASRASRTESLLVDALRMRAVRLFPRDPERQDEAVAEFWGYLLAGERAGSLPILARYDGQRPLVPWLIRVFQNKHLSDLRHDRGRAPLPDDDFNEGDLRLPGEDRDGHEERWHDEFRQAARDWLARAADNDVLLLGLRLRYRLSQREVAHLLGIHEGNVSRQTARLRDGCLEAISAALAAQGWTGDDLSGFVLKEMDSLLLDEPRLAADRLAALLAARGKSLTVSRGE
jgi:RNA polymerase sigma factor (sigma-70 family)